MLTTRRLPTPIPQRKRDEEREAAALVDFRIHTELAAQLLDAPRDYGKPEAESGRCALLWLGRLDLLKLAEDVLKLVSRDATARVVHDKLDSNLLRVPETFRLVKRAA